MAIGTRPLTAGEQGWVWQLSGRGRHMVKLALPELRRFDGVSGPFKRVELETFRRGAHGAERLEVRLIRHLLDALVAGAITSASIEGKRKTARFRGEEAFVLGAYWASLIARTTKYGWVAATDGTSAEAIAIVSPARGCVIYPFAFVDGILNHGCANTSALVHAMLHEDPEQGMPAGSHTLLG